MFGINVGRGDRVARAVLGAGLLACAAWRLTRSSGKTLPLLGAVAGATLLYTAVTASCPIYAALGVSTSKESTTGEPLV